MNAKWLWPWASVVGMLLSGAPVLGAEQPPPNQNMFMQLKLKNAQMVLDNLALGNFDRVEEGADYLVRLSKKTEFQKKDVPNYDRYNEEFRRSAESILSMARAKNREGAVLAYVRLTMSCVECHKHLREVK